MRLYATCKNDRPGYYTRNCAVLCINCCRVPLAAQVRLSGAALRRVAALPRLASLQLRRCGDGVNDEALAQLAPLAGTLEVSSVQRTCVLCQQTSD